MIPIWRRGLSLYSSVSTSTHLEALSGVDPVSEHEGDHGADDAAAHYDHVVGALEVLDPGVVLGGGLRHPGTLSNPGEEGGAGGRDKRKDVIQGRISSCISWPMAGTKKYLLELHAID